MRRNLQVQTEVVIFPMKVLQNRQSKYCPQCGFSFPLWKLIADRRPRLFFLCPECKVHLRLEIGSWPRAFTLLMAIALAVFMALVTDDDDHWIPCLSFAVYAVLAEIVLRYRAPIMLAENDVYSEKTPHMPQPSKRSLKLYLYSFIKYSPFVVVPGVCIWYWFFLTSVSGHQAITVARLLNWQIWIPTIIVLASVISSAFAWTVWPSSIPGKVK